MKVTRGFNAERIKGIANNCGSDSVRTSISYIGAPFVKGNKGFVCETFDGVAFFAGVMCKSHFRLYEIAVQDSEQRKGYGQAMITRIRHLCIKSGVPTITLRTSKQETAFLFYEKMGGCIVGEKDGDYEIEIKVL